MNLIDAIKSGRPIRALNEGPAAWIYPGKTNPDWLSEHYYYEDGTRRAWILRDFTRDWEIQEPTVTITRSQLYDAFEAAWNDQRKDEPLRKTVARRLGLEAP